MPGPCRSAGGRDARHGPVEGVQRIGRPPCMGDLGVAEAHGQVEPTVPGGHHRPPGQPLEGHVPQPAGVEPVGRPGVDREHHGPVGSARSRRGGRRWPSTRPGSWPAGAGPGGRDRWVRAKRPATSSTAASRASATAGGAQPVDRPPSPSAISGAATATMAALARLNWPGQADVDRPAAAVGRHQVPTLEPRVAVRAGEVAPVARPLPVRGRRRSRPRTPGSPPRRRATPGRPPPTAHRERRGRPRHHRIVGVGHHHGGRPVPGPGWAARPERPATGRPASGPRRSGRAGPATG